MVKGAVFDMDGLMIDSERIVLKGYEFAAKKFGYDDRILKLAEASIGRTKNDTRIIFNEAMGGGFDYDEFKPYVSDFVKDWYIKNGIPVKKGLFEILDALKGKGYRLCVATSTSRRTATDQLMSAKIMPYFDDLVGGDDIKNGKPAPDIFLEAAARIGAKPEDCFVFEDSINGIKAAYSAGTKPIMIPDIVMPTDEILPMIYRKYTSLDQAVELLIGEENE